MIIFFTSVFLQIAYIKNSYFFLKNPDQKLRKIIDIQLQYAGCLK